eukprot:PLAT6557.1.p1 GENE.PLAT6557.1~~PLAT6557.1.p1  ORF type:complete len:391 (+),score=92.85 PLAT6557.1:50-1222(+)
MKPAAAVLAVLALLACAAAWAEGAHSTAQRALERAPAARTGVTASEDGLYLLIEAMVPDAVGIIQLGSQRACTFYVHGDCTAAEGEAISDCRPQLLSWQVEARTLVGPRRAWLNVSISDAVLHCAPQEDVTYEARRVELPVSVRDAWGAPLEAARPLPTVRLLLLSPKLEVLHEPCMTTFSRPKPTALWLFANLRLPPPLQPTAAALAGAPPGYRLVPLTHRNESSSNCTAMETTAANGDAWLVASCFARVTAVLHRDGQPLQLLPQLYPTASLSVTICGGDRQLQLPLAELDGHMRRCDDKLRAVMPKLERSHSTGAVRLRCRAPPAEGSAEHQLLSHLSCAKPDYKSSTWEDRKDFLQTPEQYVAGLMYGYALFALLPLLLHAVSTLC